MINQDSDIAMETRHFSHSLHSPLSLKQRPENTRDTDDGYGTGIIVVVVQGPEYDRSDLEYVERVEDLVDKESED